MAGFFRFEGPLYPCRSICLWTKYIDWYINLIAYLKCKFSPSFRLENPNQIKISLALIRIFSMDNYSIIYNDSRVRLRKLLEVASKNESQYFSKINTWHPTKVGIISNARNLCTENYGSNLDLFVYLWTKPSSFKLRRVLVAVSIKLPKRGSLLIKRARFGNEVILRNEIILSARENRQIKTTFFLKLSSL